MPTNFKTPIVTNPTLSDGLRAPSPMSFKPTLSDVQSLQVWVHSHIMQLKRNIYSKCFESFWLLFSSG